MSRPLRIEYAEGVYHVTSRGNVNRLIDYARGYEEVREIPKVHRYLNRPSLAAFQDFERRQTEKG
jgi:hypothetical protein